MNWRWPPKGGEMTMKSETNWLISIYCSAGHFFCWESRHTRQIDLERQFKVVRNTEEQWLNSQNSTYLLAWPSTGCERKPNECHVLRFVFVWHLLLLITIDYNVSSMPIHQQPTHTHIHHWFMLLHRSHKLSMQCTTHESISIAVSLQQCEDSAFCNQMEIDSLSLYAYMD